MGSEKKSRTYIIDTSAILSGKPINVDNCIITTSGVEDELKPGGRDFRTFEFLKEKGLAIQDPSKESIAKIKAISENTGDIDRLSDADKQILALALDVSKENEAVILTDDYSIQNVACSLGIKCESISQRGITKNFKWAHKCSGCGKKFKENIKVCPICGALTKNIVIKKSDTR